MKKLNALLKRWHRRLLLLLLATTLTLIIALSYRITQKQEVTQRQNLTISANAWLFVKKQAYNILTATMQQDYTTYTELQRSMGENGNLTTLTYAANISYESQFMESIRRKKLIFGEDMIGILFFGDTGEELTYWFQDSFPFKNSITSLVKDVHGLQDTDKTEREIAASQATPTSASNFRTAELSELLALNEEQDNGKLKTGPSRIRLLEILQKSFMLLDIPLAEQARMIFVLDPHKEFAQADFYIEASGQTNYVHRPDELGDFQYLSQLLGLTLTFSVKHEVDGSLWFILPAAFLILILILYQFNIAMVESQSHELSGLPNMRVFEKHLHEALKKPGVTFLFFMDLRNLKQLNTIFLEEQADKVIKSFASTLRGVLDRSDSVIHRSGDEILAIMTLVEVQMLEFILMRIRQTFAQQELRLMVHNSVDRHGAAIKLYGQELVTGSFVKVPISFRIGGLAIDSERQHLSREQLLEQANLLEEEAKQLEDEAIPSVVWLVKYQLNEAEFILRGPHPKVTGPRLVVGQ